MMVLIQRFLHLFLVRQYLDIHGQILHLLKVVCLIYMLHRVLGLYNLHLLKVVHLIHILHRVLGLYKKHVN